MDPDPSIYLLNTLFETEFILLSLFLLLLLFCSGLISGSEVAFFSIGPSELNELQSQEDLKKKDKKILKLLNSPGHLLATILISNNIINVAIIVLSNFLIDTVFESMALNDEDIMAHIGAIVLKFYHFQFIFKTLVVTFFLVLFGEVGPKIYANVNNLKLARMMAIPLDFLKSIFKPLNYFLVNSTTIIENRFASADSISKDEINKAIELTVKNEENSKREVEILNSLVRFGEVTAKQIMAARVNIKSIEFTTNYTNVLKLIRESGYSRYPIYSEDLDNITGILYVKDLIDKISEGVDFEWQELIRDVMFVPENKKINNILSDFKVKKIHMAMVVDEYGGTAGLLTMEDIIEEIVGDIKDEFDDEDIEYEKINEFTYLFEGKTLLNDISRLLKIDETTFDEIKGASDSIAGLTLEVLGRIPKKNDFFIYKGYNIKVIDVDKRKIKKIQFVSPIDKKL